ncbi:MAG: GldG family protein [Ruminococcus sp.]|nr:GldG family protein [Ruminococcus sp.]
MSKKEKETSSATQQEETSSSAAEVNAAEETPAAVKEKKPRGRKLKYGSMSAAVMILVIAIVIVFNLMCGLLMKRYPVKIDLTPDKRFELTDETIEAVKALDKDIDVVVTTPKDTFDYYSSYFRDMYMQYYGVVVDMPYDIIPEILEKYSIYAESGKGSINVKYVDITKDPDVIAKYNQYYSGEIAEGSIIVAAGDRVKVISKEEVYQMITPSSTSTQTNIQMTFVGESTLTSAIMAVSDANPVNVAVATTMNGASLYETNYAKIVESFISFLDKNGYIVSQIDLATDDLSPDDYDMVVIAVPNVDFGVDIIDKMSDFMYNDGKYDRHMVYVPNLYATNLPNLTEFLADWNIEIDDKAILDDNMMQTPISALGVVDYAPIISVADTETVGTLTNPALNIVAPGARAVNILSKNNETVSNAILTSSDTSYLASLTEETDLSADKGSRNVAVISRKETAEGFDVYSSKLLVLGSSFMLDNAVLTNTNTYNDANVLTNILASVTGKEAGVVIPEKALQQTSIAPTQNEMNVIRITVIFAIPLIVAVIGTIVLLRRRNK